MVMIMILIATISKFYPLAGAPSSFSCSTPSVCQCLSSNAHLYQLLTNRLFYYALIYSMSFSFISFPPLVRILLIGSWTDLLSASFPVRIQKCLDFQLVAIRVIDEKMYDPEFLAENRFLSNDDTPF